MLDQIKVHLINMMGDDRTITNAALVSSGKDISEERHEKLLKKLIVEGHHSCLEHVVFSFSLEIPKFVASQLVRHRVGWSFNESSVRYGFSFEDFYRFEGDTIDYDIHCHKALDLYKEAKATKDKRLIETLGRCLPQSVMVKMVVTCNLRSFMHFYKLRADSHAQLEIQHVAKEMLRCIRDLRRFDKALEFLGV